MSELNTIRVAAAIISKDGAVLACKRSQGEFAGMWEFPGGKVKEGETALMPAAEKRSRNSEQN